MLPIITVMLGPFRRVWLAKNVSAIRKGKERKGFYLTTHSTHFIYGYMASDIW